MLKAPKLHADTQPPLGVECCMYKLCNLAQVPKNKIVTAYFQPEEFDVFHISIQLGLVLSTSSRYAETCLSCHAFGVTFPRRRIKRCACVCMLAIQGQARTKAPELMGTWKAGLGARGSMRQ